MENKYFTPDIEDIHVGYECEIKQMLYNIGVYAQMQGKEESYQTFYTPVIIGKEYPIPKTEEFTIDKLEAVMANCYNKNPSVNRAIELLKNGKLQTLYLTKEQIEAEGWKEISRSHFTKKDIFVKVYIGYLHDETLSFRISIYNDTGTLFKGECKDINTFRKLCKLLHI